MDFVAVFDFEWDYTGDNCDKIKELFMSLLNSDKSVDNLFEMIKNMGHKEIFTPIFFKDFEINDELIIRCLKEKFLVCKDFIKKFIYREEVLLVFVENYSILYNEIIYLIDNLKTYEKLSRILGKIENYKDEISIYLTDIYITNKDYDSLRNFIKEEWFKLKSQKQYFNLILIPDDDIFEETERKYGKKGNDLFNAAFNFAINTGKSKAFIKICQNVIYLNHGYVRNILMKLAISKNIEAFIGMLNVYPDVIIRMKILLKLIEIDISFDDIEKVWRQTTIYKFFQSGSMDESKVNRYKLKIIKLYENSLGKSEKFIYYILNYLSKLKSVKSYHDFITPMFNGIIRRLATKNENYKYVRYILSRLEYENISNKIIDLIIFNNDIDLMNYILSSRFNLEPRIELFMYSLEYNKDVILEKLLSKFDKSKIQTSEVFISFIDHLIRNENEEILELVLSKMTKEFIILNINNIVENCNMHNFKPIVSIFISLKIYPTNQKIYKLASRDEVDVLIYHVRPGDFISHILKNYISEKNYEMVVFCTEYNAIPKDDESLIVTCLNYFDESILNRLVEFDASYGKNVLIFINDLLLDIIETRDQDKIEFYEKISTCLNLRKLKEKKIEKQR